MQKEKQKLTYTTPESEVVSLTQDGAICESTLTTLSGGATGEGLTGPWE